MRYLFRGLVRETGKIVEGHVEGASPEAAYNSLADNGIVTESLTADPKPLNLNEELPEAPEFADALESAFDSSSSQVAFDDLVDRYHGKKVWVIDRDKIRRRVAQVVDAALALSHQHDEGAGAMRARVANAIHGLFSDARNISTERNADSVMGFKIDSERAAPAPPAPSRAVAPGARLPASDALEEQIARLANVVRQAETAMASIAAAARRVGRGGGPIRHRSDASLDEGHKEVLLEIFKSNLELQHPLEAVGADTGEQAQPAS